MNDHNSSDERIQTLTDLLARVLAMQEVERRTVIHTLQENVGQTLAALSLNLRVLERYNDHPQVSEMIDTMRELATDTMREIDRLHQDIYPLALGSQGIVSAVETYARTFAHESQIQVVLDAEVLPYRPPHDVEIMLFRIVQDILEHLRDQQGVSWIKVRLRLTNGYIYLVIESDGPSEVLSWRTNLMDERVRSLKGQCAKIPLPEAGARFEIALPLRNRTGL